MSHEGEMSNDDAILRQRAMASRMASIGQRIGYGLYALATIALLYGLAFEFSDGVSTFVVASIVVGSAFLAPAIVIGYAVKAAVRDDIEHGRDIGDG